MRWPPGNRGRRRLPDSRADWNHAPPVKVDSSNGLTIWIPREDGYHYVIRAILAWRDRGLDRHHDRTVRTGGGNHVDWIAIGEHIGARLWGTVKAMEVIKVNSHCSISTCHTLIRRCREVD